MQIQSLSKISVLYVEDEILVALDGEAMLREMGFVDVAVSYSLDDAERLLHTRRFDLALMDINLGGGKTSLRLAAGLKSRGVPIVFTTGYNGSEGLAEPFAAPVVEKPFDDAGLRRAISDALGASVLEHPSAGQHRHIAS